MTIDNCFTTLLEQMKSSELECYKILDEIPSSIKFVAGGFIEKVKLKLEAENEKVWEKIKEMGKILGREAEVEVYH